MRISDWSSDVCSSDLCLARTGIRLPRDHVEPAPRIARAGLRAKPITGARRVHRRPVRGGCRPQVPRCSYWRQGILHHDALRPNGYAVSSASSAEHTSDLQSLIRISYAVFCLLLTIFIVSFISYFFIPFLLFIFPLLPFSFLFFFFFFLI